MKKIFTFCAALFVALTALARVDVAPVKMEFDEAVMKAALAQMDQNRLEGKCKNIGTRSYVDPSTGVTYTLNLYYQGYFWPKMFGEEWTKQFPTFESFPFYVVQAVVIGFGREETKGNDVLSYLMGWPCNYSGTAKGTYEVGDPGWDDFMPLESWGAESTPNFEVLQYGYVGGFGILNGCWTQWENRWNGKTGYQAAGSTVNFSGYETEDRFMNANFRGTLVQLGEEGEGDVVTAYNLKYSGSIWADGFFPLPKIGEYGEVHIFNTGEAKGDDDAWFNNLGYYDEDWGPLQRYYFIAMGKDLELAVDPYNGVDRYNISNIRCYIKEGVTDDHSTGITYLKGAFYSDANDVYPTGVWNQTWFTFEQKGLAWEQIGVPEAGKVILSESFSAVSQDCPFLRNDCVYGVWCNEAVDFDGNSDLIVANGTPDGFLIHGTDAFENPYNYNFKGKVYYHYNPSNIAEYREEDAVGDVKLPGAVETVATEANKVSAANGVISVVVAEDAQVAIYAPNGAMINKVNAKAGQIVKINVAKGLYIVKAGSTVKKVIL